MSNTKIYVKFPRAGLGNMMLVWARAYVFSHRSSVEMHTTSWTKIHPGAILRRERKRRLYLGYFKSAGIVKKLRFLFYDIVKKKVSEPFSKDSNILTNNELIIFNKIFIEYDFYKELRPYKQLIKKAIFDILKPKLIKKFNECEKPEIGVHIRRGDFKKASTITPLSFFMDVIIFLRREAKKDLKVIVFTDADNFEIDELLQLGNVFVAESKADILDLLLLAESKTLLLSIGSTFSYWAAFLSDGKIIKHNKEWHVPFRDKNDKGYSNEMTWDEKAKNLI